jgi:hypothetical protein
MQHRSVHRIRVIATLSGIVFALAGFAHAGGIRTQRSPKAEKPNKGILRIAAVTTVGDLTLEPGEYEVKQVNSAAGTLVRFTRYTYDPYAPEGVSSHQWETVGQAKVTTRALAAKATQTKLLLASQGDKALGLEISGKSAEYWF